MSKFLDFSMVTLRYEGHGTSCEHDEKSSLVGGRKWLLV